MSHPARRCPHHSTRHEALEMCPIRPPSCQAAIDHLNSAAMRRFPDDPGLCPQQPRYHRLGRRFAGGRCRIGSCKRHRGRRYSDAIEANPRCGAGHAAIAKEVLGRNRRSKPVVGLSGGETAMTLRAKGGKGVTASSRWRQPRLTGTDPSHRRRRGRHRRLGKQCVADVQR